MDTLKQLPTTWWGKEMTEKSLAPIAAGGKKNYFLPLVESYTEENPFEVFPILDLGNRSPLRLHS